MSITKRVVLAGGSGFLGQWLAKELERKDYEVVVLTRSPSLGHGPITEVSWDGKAIGDWTHYLEGAEALVNLAGRSVNCRYTPENRREIIDSRVNSIHAIGQAVLNCKKPPKAWIQAASLAIYGDPGEHVCDENAPFGKGFSAEVCMRWEQAFSEVQLPVTRKAVFRIGFALQGNGGAMYPLTKLTKLFLGGSVSHGRQYISWLHVEDLNRMFIWGIERDDIKGVFNATGTAPVTNTEFMKKLRHVLYRPWSPPTPAWMVRIGAKFMATEPELALTGRRCLPQRFLEKGFQFRYEDLEKAFRDILTRKTVKPSQ
ncbi:MAG: TIGR01777 family protein [Kiritimatiellae bacterium]|nr:TIGR01777 family protein [Kiritimatiellia bacterium]